jgi:phage FluMu protein Com
MIVLQESAAEVEMTKPVICPKCKRGKLGNIPQWNEAVLSKRGKSPPNERNPGVQLKCPKCRALWVLTVALTAN